jgi:hypothetical protein
MAYVEEPPNPDFGSAHHSLAGPIFQRFDWIAFSGYHMKS